MAFVVVCFGLACGLLGALSDHLIGAAKPIPLEATAPKSEESDRKPQADRSSSDGNTSETSSVEPEEWELLEKPEIATELDSSLTMPPTTSSSSPQSLRSCITDSATPDALEEVNQKKKTATDFDEARDIAQYFFVQDPDLNWGCRSIRIVMNLADGTIVWSFFRSADDPAPPADLEVSIFDPDPEDQQQVAAAFNLLRDGRFELPVFRCAPDFKPDYSLLEGYDNIPDDDDEWLAMQEARFGPIR
jgi:hypothetical protein